MTQSTTTHRAPTRPGILVGLKAEAQLIRGVFPHAAIAASGATSAGAQREANRLAACGADCLLSFGLAAGLDPALPPGTIVIPSAVQAWGNVWPSEPTLRHILGGEQAGVISGPLLHSDQVVLQARHKADLFAATHCAALDMESGFLARAAHEAGLPFAVLRVVCDPATRSLPPHYGLCSVPRWWVANRPAAALPAPPPFPDWWIDLSGAGCRAGTQSHAAFSARAGHPSCIPAACRPRHTGLIRPQT